MTIPESETKGDEFRSSPLLQSRWWGRVKSATDWSVVSEEPLALKRAIGPIKLVYAPHAFGDDGEIAGNRKPFVSVTEANDRLREIGERASATLVRWDVPWRRDFFDAATSSALGEQPSPVRIQPSDTVIIPLDRSEDEILASMKSKTRYNVRLATKKGVVVTAYQGEEIPPILPKWYQLYRETANRDRIAIHPLDYYMTVVKTALDMERNGEPAPKFSLYIATHEGDLLVGIVVASWTGTSTYLYGASSNKKRNLMPSYVTQWTAMRGAASAGDIRYDMFGIPPSDDPKHPMHGLYRFKTGFGGAIVHRAGAWDLPIRPVASGLFRTAERARGWYFYRFRKR